MKITPKYSERSLVRNIGASLLLFAATCATSSAQVNDLFVTFHDTDLVSLFNATTGAALNSGFTSVPSPTGLTFGPDGNLYVGSDNLPSGGAGIVRVGINGLMSSGQSTFVSHISDNNLNNPQGLAFVGANLYVADITAGQVFVYNSSGVPGTPLPGANINGPIGLAAYAGNLYIADSDSGNVLRYNGATVSQVNTQNNVFISAQDVSVGFDGNLYVLNPSQGIYRLSLSDGSATKIVDYSTSFIEATDLVVGPDGKLYVAGVDGNTAEGGVFQYNLDGTGGSIFADTGPGTMPDGLVFAPEPGTCSLAALSIAVVAGYKFRKAKRAMRS
jgi:sugar lactone lactonase YvrE